MVLFWTTQAILAWTRLSQAEKDMRRLFVHAACETSLLKEFTLLDKAKFLSFHAQMKGQMALYEKLQKESPAYRLDSWHFKHFATVDPKTAPRFGRMATHIVQDIRKDCGKGYSERQLRDFVINMFVISRIYDAYMADQAAREQNAAAILRAIGR